MTAPQPPAMRPFPELERLERMALSYAWSMLYLGVGIGFVLAWIICSAHSCEPPRQPVTPHVVTPAPHSVRSDACQNGSHAVPPCPVPPPATSHAR